MEDSTKENILHGIEEVKVTNDENESNRLLEHGWILLSVASGQEQTGAHDHTPFFAFCLGRPMGA